METEGKAKLEEWRDWEEADPRHWFFPEYAVEELLKDEEYLRLRERSKAASKRQTKRKSTSSV